MRLSALFVSACAATFLHSAAHANVEAEPRLTVEQRIPVADGAAALDAAAAWLAAEAEHNVHIQWIDDEGGILWARGTTAVAPSLRLAERAVAGDVSWRLELTLEGGDVVAKVTDLDHTTNARGTLAVNLGILTDEVDPGLAVCDTVQRRPTPCARGHRAACVVLSCDEDWRKAAWKGVREAVEADVQAFLTGLAKGIDGI